MATVATKVFHVGDVLSAMTGRLVSKDHIDGLYRILDHLTGESLMTHQLPRAGREVEGVLRERYPSLAGVQVPDWQFAEGDDRKAIVMGWLDGVAAEVGEWWEVEPLAAEDHTRIDPVDELKMIRPDLPIVGIVAGGGE